MFNRFINESRIGSQTKKAFSCQKQCDMTFFYIAYCLQGIICGMCHAWCMLTCLSHKYQLVELSWALGGKKLASCFQWSWRETAGKCPLLHSYSWIYLQWNPYTVINVCVVIILYLPNYKAVSLNRISRGFKNIRLQLEDMKTYSESRRHPPRWKIDLLSVFLVLTNIMPFWGISDI